MVWDEVLNRELGKQFLPRGARVYFCPKTVHSRPFHAVRIFRAAYKRTTVASRTRESSSLCVAIIIVRPA